jgi:hypothetical protein
MARLSVVLIPWLLLMLMDKCRRVHIYMYVCALGPLPAQKTVLITTLTIANALVSLLYHARERERWKRAPSWSSRRRKYCRFGDLGFGIWDLIPMLFLTILAAGRGRGSAEYSGPFPNFPNAPVDPSQIISGYGPALVSDSLNPMSR